MKKTLYPLSYPQKNIWYSEKLFPNTSLAHNNGSLEISGSIDLGLLQKAINAVIEKNDALRLRIIEADGEPRQYIGPYTHHKVECINLENKNYNDIRIWEIEKNAAPFKLIDNELFYFAIIKVQPGKIRLFIKLHHLISDAISFMFIYNQIAGYYSQLVGNFTINPVQHPSYIEYIKHEQELVKTADFAEYKKYWQKRFATVPEFIYLKNHPREISTQSNRKAIPLSANLSKRMDDFCKKEKISALALFMSLLSVYFFRVTAKNDISIGTTIINRLSSNRRPAIGMYTNTLPLRLRITGNPALIEYVHYVYTECLKLIKNRKYPYSLLLDDFHKKNKTGEPLFDISFTYQVGKLDLRNVFSDYDVQWHNYGHQINSLSINLLDFNNTGNYLLSYDYLAACFSDAEIMRLHSRIMCLLNDLLEKSDQPVSEAKILPAEETVQILDEFNNMDVPFSEYRTITELFENQVEKIPLKTAVSCAGKQINYLELNEKANQIARVLRDQGAGEKKIVAFMAERSLEMIVGMLGILKTGSAYLAIEPDLPTDRMQYILTNSEAAILLTRQGLDKDIKLPIRRVYMGGEDIADQKKENPDYKSGVHDSAYIIYTSGSTGKPKGIFNSHKSVYNLIQFYIQKLDLTEKDRVSQVTSYTFDASVAEIFPALATGGTVVITPSLKYTPLPEILFLLVKEQITFVTFSPSLLKVVLPHMNSDLMDRWKCLRLMLCGGETFSQGTVNQFFTKCGSHIKLINIYGPTETTVFSTYYHTTGGEAEDYQIVPIGRPIINTRIYILDDNGQVQPIGAEGEIHISGEGLAEGYLNNTELTKQKFVVNPFLAGTKMYKTGDMGKWREDGNIEFTGRKDDQIKLRGFRIEPEEIVKRLLKFPGIKDAVVVALTDRRGNQFLCAYIVCLQEVKTSALRQHLARELPAYMIPSYFVRLEALPLTPNVKVDIKKLPYPDEEAYSSAEYEPPRNNTEEILAGIWQDVLGVSRVGINDNFFELGGDSIKAMQITTRLLQFSLKLEMKDLFGKQTLCDTAAMIRKLDSGVKMDQEIIEGEVNLSPAQLWFFAQKFNAYQHWNQTFMLYRRKGFDFKMLEKVINRILVHHDVLRMIYSQAGDEIVQYNRGIAENNLYSIKEMQIADEREITGLAQQEQGCMDLQNGPLVRLVLFRTGGGDHLLIAIHHLVVDGVTWRILLEDLANGYTQAQEGKEIQFPLKTTSFREWTEKLYAYAEGNTVHKELAYWQKVNILKPVPLPADNPVTTRTMHNCTVAELKFDELLTEKILRKTSRAYNTEINDILLAGFCRALYEWAGLSEILINLEGHGREEIIPDVNIHRTAGWFTTSFPVLLKIPRAEDYAHTIKAVKEELRKVPRKGINYGILKYLVYGQDRDAQFGLSPEITFNYLGDFGQDFNREGIFELSPLDPGNPVAGDCQRLFKLELNGIIRNRELSLLLSYDKDEYAGTNIEKLLQILREKLERLTEHCESRTETEKTASDYGETELSLDEFEEINREYKGNIKHIYRLTPMQEGMLFLKLMEENSENYFQQLCMSVKGTVDVEVYQRSFTALVNRHDIFRTAIYYAKINSPRQIVLQQVTPDFACLDLSEHAPGDIEAVLKDFQEKDKKRGFDFPSGKLIRVTVIKLISGEYRIIWSFHHIIMDGWCMGIINREMMQIYEAGINGKTIVMDEPPPYVHYIQWLAGRDKEKAAAYWNEYLSGYNQCSYPVRAKKDMEGTGVSEFVILDLGMEKTRQLEKVAQLYSVTLNICLQVIWCILLQRYNNCDDVAFGVVVSGRPAEVEGIETMVGLFINTIPVRIRKEKREGIKDICCRVQKQALESEKFFYLPLAEIQAMTALKADLLSHIFVFENYPLDRAIINGESSSGFSVEGIELFERTNFDFNLIVFPGESLQLKIGYRTPGYTREICNRILSHFQEVINQVIDEPQIDPDSLEILSREEKRKILKEYNNTFLAYPREKTIIEIFEEQVKKSPGAIAVVYKEQQITYDDLNSKANQLGLLLRGMGIKPNSIVPILTGKSPAMIIGVMGILKAGGAYLPLNPEYPAERLSYILKDSEATILITERAFEERRKDNLTVIYLDDEEFLSGKSGNLPRSATPDDLAYIIYTSGTTGNPKGVMIENHCIVNLLDAFDLNKDRVIQFAPFSFDASAAEIFTTLLSGSTLFIVPRELINDTVAFEAYMDKNEITYVAFPPNYLEYLDPQKLPLLKRILSAGSVLSPELYNKWIKGRALHNGYGPTETTVISTLWKSGGTDLPADTVPIGKPIANTRIYILDKQKRLQPIGVEGEIFISGDGLARGYLKQEQLTAEKFIVNPYEPGGKMYRTGDMGKWLADGNIEFFGRIDNQVKIRGFRIELAEIENQLLKLEEIKEVLVMAQENKEKQKFLCAYLTARKKMSTRELRQSLAKALPDYMIPTCFIQLEKMPLTANGKIDTKALTELEWKMESEVEYQMPGNEIEEKLCMIWQEVLGMDRIGINDNFFDLGGHSLLAIKVISQVRQVFGIELPLQVLFAKPTVCDLAISLKMASLTGIPIPSILLDTSIQDESRSFSFDQQQLWFRSNLVSEEKSPDIPIVVRLIGSLDLEVLEQSFNLVNRRYTAVAENIFDTEKEPLINIDLRALPDQEQKLHKLIMEEASHSLGPDDPLIRIRLFQEEETVNVLMLLINSSIEAFFSGIISKQIIAAYQSLLQKDSG